VRASWAATCALIYSPKASKQPFFPAPSPRPNRCDFLGQLLQILLPRFVDAPLLFRLAPCVPHTRQVARNSDVVFTMLGLPSEVEDVVLGRTGLLRNLAPGSIVVDMSTSRPELACRIAGGTLHA
jgi:hypothetical protein